MPLAEGQAFDNGLFKLYAGLVRDIKMAVSVVSCLTLATVESEYMQRLNICQTDTRCKKPVCHACK